MIQRIQSVYLTLVLVFSILCFAFPIANYEFKILDTRTEAQLNLIPKTIDENTLNEIGQEGYVNTLPLILIIVAVGILSIVSVFLFKKRAMQIRVIAITMLVDMVYIGLIFLYYVDKFANVLELNFKTMTSVSYSVGSMLPILSLILLFMANKAVRKDEKLVRSADRLR